MDQNEFSTETNLNGVKSSQVSLEPPKKKVNKGLVILAALLIITAAGAITVGVMGPAKVMNQLHKTFTSKESYYHWLEEENAEAILKVLCTDEKEESNVAADISIMPGSTFATLLSVKDPVQIHTEINQKDQQMQGMFKFSYKDKELGNVTAFMDQKTNEIYVLIPEISKKYVSVDLSGDDLNTQFFGTKDLPKMVSKYIGTLLKDIEVTLKFEKEDELSIGSMTVKGDKIIAAYSLKDTYQALSDMFKTMKSDEKLQEACEMAGVTKAVYRQYLDNLSATMTEKLNDISDNDGIIFTCYVDDAGAIRGREISITMGKDSYEITYILTEKEIAVSIGQNGAQYLIASCDYSIQDKSNDFEPVAKEQTLTAAQYKAESGSDFMSDFLLQILDNLGLSQVSDMILQTLGLTQADAGTFEFTLGEYKGLVLNVEEMQVTDEDIDQAVIDFVKYDSDMLPITDRDDIKEGDCVNLDYTGTVDGKDFEYNSAKDYEIKIGENQFLDGVDEQLIGKKVGETVTVSAKLPETYTDTALAGKDAEFTVKINAIGIREFTDAFVAYNTDYASTDEYRDYLYEGLVEQKKYNDQSAADEAILGEIVVNAEFSSVNQSEIDAKYKEMQDTYQTYAEYYGVDMETFAMSAFGLSLDDFNEEVRYYAEEYVKETYVLAKIAELENIELSEEEYKQMASDSLEEYQYESIEQLEEKNGGYEKVKQSLLEEKVMKFLRENNEVKNQ